MRDAEANVRRAAREKAGLARLGPGALELAAFMDLTGSFLLVQSQPKILSRAPTSGGRLAAPVPGIPAPGSASFGTYAMTMVTFAMMVDSLTDKAPPGSMSAALDPTVDTVTIGGNKGKITTKIFVSAQKSASKISLIINGEVRDATTGALLFSITSEATGKATGDVCPDASGIAHAHMSFTGHEEYFDATGTKSGSSYEDYGSEMRFKADDDAKLAGVDFSPTGDDSGDLMIRLAARQAAPSFEKAWRSGICIEVLIDPPSQDVDKDSETTVTVKVKHKIEGNELDKEVKATFSGVKSLDPADKKQKAPATYKFIAGPKDDDKGDISFESVSNRGIGHAGVTYTVGRGPWTVNSTGTYVSTFTSPVGSGTNTYAVVIKDLRLTAGAVNSVSGSGTMSIVGDLSSTGVASCTGHVDRSFSISASGTVVGTGAGAVLRLTLDTDDDGDHEIATSCTIAGRTYPGTDESAGGLQEYGSRIGQFDLPAGGGTKTVTRTDPGPNGSETTTGAFRVVHDR